MNHEFYLKYKPFFKSINIEFVKDRLNNTYCWSLGSWGKGNILKKKGNLDEKIIEKLAPLFLLLCTSPNRFQLKKNILKYTKLSNFRDFKSIITSSYRKTRIYENIVEMIFHNIAELSDILIDDIPIPIKKTVFEEMEKIGRPYQFSLKNVVIIDDYKSRILDCSFIKDEENLNFEISLKYLPFLESISKKNIESIINQTHELTGNEFVDNTNTVDNTNAVVLSDESYNYIVNLLMPFFLKIWTSSLSISEMRDNFNNFTWLSNFCCYDYFIEPDILEIHDIELFYKTTTFTIMSSLIGFGHSDYNLENLHYKLFLDNKNMCGVENIFKQDSNLSIRYQVYKDLTKICNENFKHLLDANFKFDPRENPRENSRVNLKLVDEFLDYQFINNQEFTDSEKNGHSNSSILDNPVMTSDYTPSKKIAAFAPKNNNSRTNNFKINNSRTNNSENNNNKIRIRFKDCKTGLAENSLKRNNSLEISLKRNSQSYLVNFNKNFQAEINTDNDNINQISRPKMALNKF